MYRCSIASHYIYRVRSKAFRYGTLVFLVGMFCLHGSQAVAQTTFQKELPTGKTHKKVKDRQGSHVPKKSKKIKYIYKKRARKLLVGNPCAVDATRKMGFEYQHHHRKLSAGEEFARVWQNTWVKTGLFFRNPFWKLKVKKKIKKCAHATGDYRG